MASKVKPVPQGFHTLTPYLTLSNAAEAIEFYKKAFGAVELSRLTGPDGGIGHAELKIGDSVLFLGDECPQMGNRSPKTLGGTAVGLHIYVEDVDALFARAVEAGAIPQMPPTDMFWGDRFGKLADPFGHSWSVGTHLEDMTPEEMQRRSVAALAKMAKQQEPAHAQA